MMEWKPATVGEVKLIVQHDLAECDVEQRETFRRYAVEPYFASIQRYGNLDNVVVVARKENEVMYWEDVEEGFNVSPLAEDGRILEHWCNQDALRFALNTWIEDRDGPPKLGPAVPAG
jgi:hypothetical protein